MTRTPTRRGGAVTVEFAIVSFAALLLLIGLIVGSLGVFRYQEIARLAREGARFASVRGNTYAQFTGKPTATQDDVYQKAVLPNVVVLDTSKLAVNVTWNPDKTVGSTVTVRVTYTWVPEAVFGGPYTLSSSATVPITY
jgi:Flp pilus assembly protein TadG